MKIEGLRSKKSESTDRFVSLRASNPFFPRLERPYITIFTTCFCQSLTDRTVKSKLELQFGFYLISKKDTRRDFEDRILGSIKLFSIIKEIWPLQSESTDRFSSSRASNPFFPRFERTRITIFTTGFCQGLRKSV